MVNDILSGCDYYTLLGVSPSATTQEIRKAFRTLSLELHPDKAKGDEEKYILLANAHEVLKNPSYRREYDDLLENGIPWQDRYYGRYAYRYGAPQVDVRIVIASLIGLITVSKYAYQLHRHKRFKRLVQQTPRFQNAVRQRKHELGLDKSSFSKGRKGKRGRTVSSGVSDDEITEQVLQQVMVVGAEAPKLKDVFILQLILFPYNLLKFIYHVVKHKILRYEYDQEAELKKKFGLSDEEFEKERKKNEEKLEQMRTSAKMKRVRRFLKKHKPVAFFPE